MVRVYESVARSNALTYTPRRLAIVSFAAVAFGMTFFLEGYELYRFTLAGAYATLYARNNQNRTLAKLDLFSHKSDQGDASGSETESVSFEMLLAPVAL